MELSLSSFSTGCCPFRQCSTGAGKDTAIFLANRTEPVPSRRLKIALSKANPVPIIPLRYLDDDRPNVNLEIFHALTPLARSHRTARHYPLSVKKLCAQQFFDCSSADSAALLTTADVPLFDNKMSVRTKKGRISDLMNCFR